MGLKYYLNFFKKDSSNEAIKLRYFLNIFVFLVYMVFFAAFSAMRSKNIIASSVFGILALTALIIYRLLSKSFTRLIDRQIAEEPLSGEDEVDAAFIAYRKGYAEYLEDNKKLDRTLYPLNIFSAILLVAFLPVTIIVNLTGNNALAEKIFSVTTIIMFAYFVLILIIGAVLARKGVWYQNYLIELTLINRYKAASSGDGIKYKILEDKKQDKQFEYILLESGFRKRFKKLQKINVVCSCIFGVLFTLSFIFMSEIVERLLLNADYAGTVTACIVWGVFLLLVATAVIIDIKQKKIIKKQYLALKENENENILYIKLHELRTPFMKRWNILFLVSFIGAIVSNILLSSIVSIIIKTDSYGFVFFLLFFAEIIATFVLYFRAYGKTRLKMMSIEDEIDKREATREVEQNFIS